MSGSQASQPTPSTAATVAVPPDQSGSSQGASTCSPPSEKDKAAAAHELRQLLLRFEEIVPMLSTKSIEEAWRLLYKHTVRRFDEERLALQPSTPGGGGLQPERLPYTHVDGILQPSPTSAASSAAEPSSARTGDGDGGDGDEIRSEASVGSVGHLPGSSTASEVDAAADAAASASDAEGEGGGEAIFAEGFGVLDGSAVDRRAWPGGPVPRRHMRLCARL